MAYDRIELKNRMYSALTLKDVKEICYDMNIDYESLSGDGRDAKILDLILLCGRRDRLEELGTVVNAQISKTVADPQRPKPAPDNPNKNPNNKIIILFLAANPKDTPQLRLDEEVRTIDERLRLAQFRDKFDIKQQWATRPSDILDAMLRYKPDIVHFSGHGSKGGELIFENASGQPQPVNAEALGALFATRKGVRCVVMNACYADAHASAISKSVDCVVGMTRAVSDAAAINFASGFYRSLGEGLNVQEAFDLGKVQIMLDGGDEQNTPHLRTRKGVDANEVKFS